MTDTLFVHQVGGGGADLLPLWTTIVGGLIAIAAAWATARASATAARQQLRATTIAATRVRWADELRNEIALLSAASLAACSDLVDGVRGEKVIARLDEVNLRVMRAELLLDSTSVAAKGLQSELDALTEAVNAVIREGPNDATVDKMDNHVKRVVSAGRAVISNEWLAARDSM